MPSVKQDPAILERDGGSSVKIKGVSYWIFDDTGTGTIDASGTDHITGFIDNSLSATTSFDATKGIDLSLNYTGSSTSLSRFIPFSPDEQAFIAAHKKASDGSCTAGSLCGASLGIWPQGVTYDSSSKVVIVGFGEVERGGGIDGYPSVGSGLALGTVGSDGWLDMTRPTQNPGTSTPTLLWSKGEQSFLNSPLILDGFYYAYGNTSDKYGNILEHLGRVPVDQLLTKSAWTYYAGNGAWSSNVANATTVFDGGDVGGSVFFNHYLNEWMTLYIGPYDNNIRYRVANAPQGPWSSAAVAATGLTGYNNTFDYALRAHGGFSPDNGMTEYVHYSHSTGPANSDLPLVKIVFSKD